MVDYGPQAPMNTTAVATAVQRRWASHKCTLLTAGAYERQRSNVVLSACSVVYLFYMTWAVCSREGNINRQHFTGTYLQNRPHTEKPGKSSYPLPPGKNFERTPHELQCWDRTETLTAGSGRSFCVDALSVLVKSARTNRYDPKQTENYTYTYTYKDLLRGVRCSPRGDANWHATGEVYQLPSSCARGVRVILNERKIWR